MSHPDCAKPVLHCHHCGREVAETLHTRTSYRVDHYALHTGDVEPTIVPRRDNPEEVVTVMRLLRPVEIFTCRDCYRQPRIRRERERLFRTEVASVADEAV